MASSQDLDFVAFQRSSIITSSTSPKTSSSAFTSTILPSPRIEALKHVTRGTPMELKSVSATSHSAEIIMPPKTPPTDLSDSPVLVEKPTISPIVTTSVSVSAKVLAFESRAARNLAAKAHKKREKQEKKAQKELKELRKSASSSSTRLVSGGEPDATTTKSRTFFSWKKGSSRGAKMVETKGSQYRPSMLSKSIPATSSLVSMVPPTLPELKGTSRFSKSFDIEMEDTPPLGSGMFQIDSSTTTTAISGLPDEQGLRLEHTISRARSQFAIHHDTRVSSGTGNAIVNNIVQVEETTASLVVSPIITQSAYVDEAPPIQTFQATSTTITAHMSSSLLNDAPTPPTSSIVLPVIPDEGSTLASQMASSPPGSQIVGISPRTPVNAPSTLPAQNQVGLSGLAQRSRSQSTHIAPSAFQQGMTRGLSSVDEGFPVSASSGSRASSLSVLSVYNQESNVEHDKAVDPQSIGEALPFVEGVDEPLADEGTTPKGRKAEHRHRDLFKKGTDIAAAVLRSPKLSFDEREELDDQNAHRKAEEKERSLTLEQWYRVRKEKAKSDELMARVERGLAAELERGLSAPDNVAPIRAEGDAEPPELPPKLLSLSNHLSKDHMKYFGEESKALNIRAKLTAERLKLSIELAQTEDRCRVLREQVTSIDEEIRELDEGRLSMEQQSSVALKMVKEATVQRVSREVSAEGDGKAMTTSTEDDFEALPRVRDALAAQELLKQNNSQSQARVKGREKVGGSQDARDERYPLPSGIN
ncbi:hypothetical protein BKA70DRAFT_1476907 [Coprinopsis sp. MPI-PUGE-AT-0042]|nr:hypothetical protein BKA70DRAFT_1476907 [Coprinopsis sp. MPI-PUGE-AT-0042]